jgi:pilus assembly protein CpaB
MMNRRAILFLLLSISFGLLTVYIFKTAVSKPAPSGGEFTIEVTPVVVAGIDLEAGVEIETIQLDVQEWPTALLPRGTFPSRRLLGKRIPVHTITAGEPILASALLVEGETAGLDSLIDTDHRAMSVKVDAVVGVAGFIRPGSRVDVLASLREIHIDRVATPYARTILQNIKVLAVDQNLTDVPGSAPEVVSVVTLQVTPAEAQILSYGSSQGKLQLALRNPVDDSLLALRSTLPKDLMDALIPVKPVPTRKQKKAVSPPPRNSIEIIRGSVSSREYL